MKSLYVLMLTILLGGCASTRYDAVDEEVRSTYEKSLGTLWVQYSTEYQAVCAQVYARARRDRPHLIADSSWSALPQQEDAQDKPPAIILDVDETVVSNADYQHSMIFASYSPSRHFDWMRSHEATPIRGAAEMVTAARSAGVEVFFVTNRSCEPYEGVPGDCPYEQVTIQDLSEAGIEVDPDHLLMAGEEFGWSKEKLHRREHIAKTHRVIMLFGDDLGDFVPCSRAKPIYPCTKPATQKSRHAALDSYADYWGNGWYILPNPMHGSWTTVR